MISTPRAPRGAALTARAASTGRRSGTTVLEVLVALVVLSLSLLPIVSLAGSNVETTRLERVRAFAESLCHNTLERFGRGGSSLEAYLVASPVDPDTSWGVDLWRASPELLLALDIEAMQPVLGRYDLHVTVQFKRNVTPGIDLVACVATWTSDRGRTARTETCRQARFIIHEHLH